MINPQTLSVHYSAGSQSVQPFPFIQYHDNGQFEVSEQALRMLEKVKGKVAVVAVAGIYRTGKSYILNQLAGKDSGRGGFQTGSTVQACTKGLWIWGEPLHVKSESGEPMDLLLMDTEGIASLERSEEANIQIFSLALLLSSFFLYNSMQTIDESAIDRLSLVAEVTKRIRRFADKKKEDPAELAQFFPNFMWLLRDFALELVDKSGRKISPKEYLEAAFRPQHGDSARVIERNNIRETLRQVFPNRDCFTMIRPTMKEDDLRNMSNMSVSQFRPEFVQQLQALKNKVFTGLKPKMVMGEFVNGVVLGRMAQEYVKAINNGAVPTIMSAWENVASVACHEASEAAREYYINGIRAAAQSGIGSYEFEQAHKKLWNEAVAIFEEKAIGSYKQNFLEKLKQEMTKEYEHLKQMVQKNDGETCQKILDALWHNVSTQQYNSSDEFGMALKNMFGQYNQQAPQCIPKLEVLLKFLSGSFSDVVSRYVKTHEEAAKEALTKQKKMKDEFMDYSQQQAAQAEQLARVNEELKGHIQNSDQEYAKLTSKFQEHEQERQLRQQELSSLQQQSQQERNALQDSKQRLESDLANLTNALNSTDAEIAAILREARQLRERVIQQVDSNLSR